MQSVVLAQGHERLGDLLVTARCCAGASPSRRALPLAAGQQLTAPSAQRAVQLLGPTPRGALGTCPCRHHVEPLRVLSQQE